MSTKKLQLKGLKRNNPAGMDDGGCDEFINLRLEKGAVRPIGPKDPIHPKPDYDKVVIHRQDDFENWIGIKGSAIDHYDQEDGVQVYQALGPISGDLYDIRTVKNFLVATTSEGLLAWIWSDDSYNAVNLTGLEDRFDVRLAKDTGNSPPPEWTDTSEIIADPETEAQSLLGFYYSKIREESGNSRHLGGMAYRVALKLFDGTYILHTVPRFYQNYHYDMLFEVLKIGLSPIGIRMRFGAGGLTAKARFDVSDGFDFEGLRKLVSSIELFASPMQEFYDITEDTLNVDFLTQIYSDAVSQDKELFNAYEYFGVSGDFKELNDQPNWYRLGSIDLGVLEDNGDFKEKLMDLDMKDYYQNYATRKTLPVDSFSHHGTSGEASYVYNNRLILGNTSQFLAKPDLLGVGQVNSRFADLDNLQPLIFDFDTQTYELYVPDPTGNAFYKAKAVVKLRSESGEKTIVNDVPIYVYQQNNDPDYKAFFLQSMSGYFDSRATSIQILLSHDSGVTYKDLITKNLTVSKYGNYAIIPFDSFDADENIVPNYPASMPKRYDVNFEAWQLTFLASEIFAAPVVDVPANDNIAKNSNGRQVSNVSNPLFYDALNYQDVSTGTIIAFGSNTDPISDSQFGSYPLYNFTSVGIWASLIGTGEVFITNDVPVNGEVILSKESKIDLSLGTVYATLEGLKILSGREPVEISGPAEGIPEINFTDNAQLQEFLNKEQTVNVQDIVDKVPFKTYLLDAAIGFSKGIDDEEIYVANPNYPYMYMFDLNTKWWCKVGTKVESFINYYPKLYALGESNTLDISTEVSGLSPVYFHTKPLSLDGFEEFKKLRRSFLRGFIQTAQGKYAAFYLFGSDDLLNWEFITGNDMNSGAFNNIWCTHSWDSKRFYVFVFAVEVDYGPDKPTWINGIELEADLKWNSKPR